MEQRAAELQARQTTVTAFGDLVNAMRGVAAARAQRARSLIAGVDVYAATVASAMSQARGIAAAAPSPEPPAQGASLWLVFCAEQGFNGGFSEQVLAAVAQAARGGRVMMLGSQGLRLAAARGMTPEWSAPAIVHADGAVPAAERLHVALAKALDRQRAAAVELVYAELRDGQSYAVCRRRLLPLEPGTVPETRDPVPLVHLAPARLMDDLAFEHVAAQLTRALLHSHAAENVSRLQAMAAAHENVERMVDALDADVRRQRQEAITAEIVELAAGLRALRTEGEIAP